MYSDKVKRLQLGHVTSAVPSQRAVLCCKVETALGPGITYGQMIGVIRLHQG